MFLAIKLRTYAKLNCLKENYLDLALNNLQRLICPKTQPNQILYIQNKQTNKQLIYLFMYFFSRVGGREDVEVFDVSVLVLTYDASTWNVCPKTYRFN